MAFITHFHTKPRLLRLGVSSFSALAVVLTLLSLSLTQASPRGHFAIRHANTELHEQVYLLNAELIFQPSEENIEALRNAVPLTFVLDIEVYRQRAYLWDEHIAHLQQRYQLKYHPLSERYILTYLNTGIRDSFSTLHQALATLNKLRDWPLLDKHLVRSNKNYQVYLQTYLDIEALPAPMRAMAYFSQHWRLVSEVYECPLQP